MMIQKSSLAIIGSFVALSLLAGNMAAAGDCGQDPIYERDFKAKAVISSRVRDIACMEGSDVLTIIAQGANVQVIAETDGWYKVQLNDGMTGWVGATLLRPLEAQAEVKKTKEVTPEKEAKTEVVDPNLAKRVAGYIVLQVQQKGEAYYVNEEGIRFYMKNGDAAYEIMRKLGLGITSADLAKLKAKNADLQKRLKGKIVLDVQKNGEAYYIYPKDGSLHYLKNGEEAYKLMRKLGLGITDKDLKKVSKVELTQYLKEKKKTVTEVKKEKKEEKTSSISGNGAIAAQSLVDGDRVKVMWSVSGMETPLGFKVVVSSSPNPVYPGNEYHYLSDSGARRDVWEHVKPGTYHFRVCEYLGGACGVYSNDVEVSVAAQEVVEEDSQNGTITLNAFKTDNGVSLAWSLAGMTSEKGFKVVWDTESNPVYPGNDYHYLSSKDARTDTVSELSSGTTYHFRVCEYLGGACGVYSNDVSINF